MATQDDDTLTGSVPDPDAEPTAAELAHARRFAELVDKTLAGRTPPAISADDRALLEVATVIRATHGGLELAADRRDALVEGALRQAIGAERAGGAAVVPIGRARARRWLPWTIAGASTLVAAAALAMLWLRPAPRPPIVEVERPRPVPVEWRSRSADALIGPIARDRAGDASARIDTIFADRLDGFRARRLARKGKP
jgi:hypothetical protein